MLVQQTYIPRNIQMHRTISELLPIPVDRTSIVFYTAGRRLHAVMKLTFLAGKNLKKKLYLSNRLHSHPLSITAARAAGMHVYGQRVTSFSMRCINLCSDVKARLCIYIPFYFFSMVAVSEEYEENNVEEQTQPGSFC